MRGIAAKGADVAHPGRLGAFERFVDQVHRHVCARQVHVGRQAVLCPRVGRQLKGQVAGRATSTPGEVDEERVLLLHPCVCVGRGGGGTQTESAKESRDVAGGIFDK